MANPEREIKNILSDNDVAVVARLIEDEQKKALEAEKQAMERKRSLLIQYFVTTSQLFLRAYRLMGSTMAVDSFMNENYRKMVVSTLEHDVIRGLGMVSIGLNVEERFFQFDPSLINAIRNARTLIKSLMDNIRTYEDRLQSGWHGEGAKGMIRDVKAGYNDHLSKLEKEVWNLTSPTIHRKVSGDVKDTVRKFEESEKLASGM